MAKSHALPFREDADLVLGPPDKTRWGYATSKLLDEFLALAYARERDLRVTVVRLFNTVGPRQSSRYGMVIPNFVKWALAGDPITIHGDGSQTRSFTWVGDVVWAMTALINEPRAFGQVFNIGNGQEISIRDLATKIREMTGSQSELIFKPTIRCSTPPSKTCRAACRISASCDGWSATNRACTWMAFSRAPFATGRRSSARRRRFRTVRRARRAGSPTH